MMLYGRILNHMSRSVDKPSALPIRRAALVVLAVVMLGMIAARGRGQEAGKDTKLSPVITESEKLIQEQLEAYNRHDLDGFLKTYSSEIKLYEFPDKELASGLDAMRKMYGTFFKESPDLKARIVKRIVQGEFIIDHEEISFGGRKRHGVAIYLVKDRKIATVWLMK